MSPGRWPVSARRPTSRDFPAASASASASAQIPRPRRPGRASDPRRQTRCPHRSQYRASRARFIPAEAMLSSEDGMALAERGRCPSDLEALMAEAAAVRDSRQDGHVISFSPKSPAQSGQRRAYMTIQEAVRVAKAGAEAGCTEALLTLGDKPELLYPEAREELDQLGHATTLSYVQEVAAAVASSTGLLPHINAGVMDRGDLARLRTVSASQGLMLESTSLRLMDPGGAHADCPDKDPALRLASIDAAGAEGIPFTSGILIGIGETRTERLQALLSLRELHLRHGHLQEIIIQNFCAKPGTVMADHPEPPVEELLWTVAAARLIYGKDMSIQAPPNLSPPSGDSTEGDTRASVWRKLLDSGINDWGGISPITRDWVNPEEAWPALPDLAEATAAAGKMLVPRLTVYPKFSLCPDRWLCSEGGLFSMAGRVRSAMDGAGWARGSAWAAGALTTQPVQPIAAVSSLQAEALGRTNASEGSQGAVSPAPGGRVQAARWGVTTGQDGLLVGCQGPPEVSPWLSELLRRVEHDGHVLMEEEMERLFSVRGSDFDEVCSAADRLRKEECGNEVSYVVNRNINYTNVCTLSCSFCAFSKGPSARAEQELRGKPYVLPLEEVGRRTAEAWERGATEVCMQGGIHPDFTGDTYLRLLDAAKSAAPGIHVHAFSPLEVSQGASTLRVSVPAYLRRLQDAGLGSLPGTAAEILDDSVREVLCPDKLSTEEWCQVVRDAHSVGLPTTSTIMFGHCDSYRSWARHLCRLREIQGETGGFTELVPLAFVHMEAPIFRRGMARKGPTLREAVLMHAVARLGRLGIRNIQASWVKMGQGHAAQLLRAGANDMGGVLMNESITRAAGAEHGQEVTAVEMEALIRGAGTGRSPQQRTTLYRPAPPEQQQRSLADHGILHPLTFGDVSLGSRL